MWPINALLMSVVLIALTPVFAVVRGVFWLLGGDCWADIRTDYVEGWRIVWRR